MMSSRCFLSRSFLACAESGDDLPRVRLGDEDPDEELSPLGASLENRVGTCHFLSNDQQYGNRTEVIPSSSLHIHANY